MEGNADVEQSKGLRCLTVAATGVRAQFHNGPLEVRNWIGRGRSIFLMMQKVLLNITTRNKEGDECRRNKKLDDDGDDGMEGG
jgi:hypothetical protein